MLQYQLKAEDAPILRLLDGIISQGLEVEASDIHLEPGIERNRVRYRIDGVLQPAQQIPMERHTARVVGQKHMSGITGLLDRAWSGWMMMCIWKAPEHSILIRVLSQMLNI